MRFLSVFFFAVLVAVLVTACGSSPPAPTAEQYFAAAKENLRAMDFDTAVKNLDRTIEAAGDQRLGQEGSLFRAVLLTALAEGDAHMANAYAMGARQTAGKPSFSAFLKFRMDYYGMARVHVMNAMEAVVAQRQNIQEEPVLLDTSFLGSRGADPLALAQIASGFGLSEQERYRAELECSRAALGRRLAAVVAASNAVDKGQATIGAPGVPVDPRAYLLEISEEFLRLSAIFSPQGLNEARYIRAANDVVLGNLRVLEVLLEKHPNADLLARARKLKTDCEERMKSLPS